MVGGVRDWGLVISVTVKEAPPTTSTMSLALRTEWTMVVGRHSFDFLSPFLSSPNPVLIVFSILLSWPARQLCYLYVPVFPGGRGQILCFLGTLLSDSSPKHVFSHFQL